MCLSAGSLVAGGYSWQEPNATITSSGDLEWAPEPFVYQAGDSVRYIDFEGGNDANDGLTTATPWQHHPWDANATQNAAAESGIHTYVFKRGAIYRGTLIADESGAEGNPIRLTSDPSWGSGEAMIYGSQTEASWTRGAHPDMPSPSNVWYAPVDYDPRRVWLVEGTNVTRIPLARTPNWTVSNQDDVKSEWWYWTSVRQTNISSTVYNICADPTHLTNTPAYYSNAVVWSEFVWVMSTPSASAVHHYDAARKALVFKPTWAGRDPFMYNRYFLEDKPEYLDAPGEYWYDQAAKRLYIRLPGDADPNGRAIEVAREIFQVRGRDVNHIHISGLTFRFANRYWDLTARGQTPDELDNASVCILGECEDIAVRNCTFEYVSKAVRAETYWYNNTLDRVAVTDNDIRETDHGAIDIRDGTPTGVLPQVHSGELLHVDVLRNRIRQVSKRPIAGDSGHAIQIRYPETAHIAGNILHRLYGAGVFVFGGKASGEPGYRSFGRILIHHNRVEDPLLNCNDWGGIETWQGGPHYVFDNISGNPGGYWHYKHMLNAGKPASERDHTSERFGFAYYLDGSFKNYVFNNVAWGRNNNLTSALCNATAFQSVYGNQNVYFNNTVYKFGAGTQRHADQSGRRKYLNNLWIDLTAWEFFVYDYRTGHTNYDYENLAYGYNVFHALPRMFGEFESNGAEYDTFTAFLTALNIEQASCWQLGMTTATLPVTDAPNHNFIPQAGSAAIDYAREVFVPWPLYDPRGEWHFRLNHKTPGKITDEHWNMRTYYATRDMYSSTKRNHLMVSGAEAGDFTTGVLDTWTASALRFDGSMQGVVQASGVGDIGLDMGTNNFAIEAFFKTAPGHANGAIVSKVDTRGYMVDIDPQGRVRLRLWNGDVDTFTRSSSVLVNDGGWHHVFIDVTRSDPDGAHIYVDGVLAEQPPQGVMPDARQDLTTGAGLVVGSALGVMQFSGTLEFLRIACGNLGDAKTTYDELYEWEFNGPQYYDFRGARNGARRDAGAFDAGAARPIIVNQPRDTTIEYGYSAGLRVAAGNVSAYQWYHDGVAVDGATGAVLAISHVTWTNQGDYCVVAGDGGEVATSEWARVTVVPEPCAIFALVGPTLVLARAGAKRRRPRV